MFLFFFFKVCLVLGLLYIRGKNSAEIILLVSVMFGPSL